MTYIPIIPQSGLQGWLFLERTLDNQKSSFSQSTQNKRESDAFKDRISDIKTAEQLVNDRELLKVSLAAFGLEGDINNKYLIRKILEEGTLNENSLANKFSDKRYLALSKAFGFGDSDTPRTQSSGFSDEILDAFKDRSFEVAVGDQDADLRLALSLDRELLKISDSQSSDNAKWLSILGNAPLKSIFERALFLPDGFGNQSLDRQIETLKNRSESRLGVSHFDGFKLSEAREKLRTNFLLASDLSSQTLLSSEKVALTLLQSYSVLRF